MLVSREKGFLFVHVPRTGGTSVREALVPWGERPAAPAWQRALVAVRVLPERRARLRGHASALEARAALGGEEFARLYKFAFVRNPWEALASAWSWLCATPSHPRHRVALELGFARYVRREAARGRQRQLRQIADRDGQVLVDFVGRHEALQRDFARVCERIDVDATLPHANASPTADWRALYDDALRAFVAEAWREDVAAFGYAFEHSAV